MLVKHRHFYLKEMLQNPNQPIIIIKQIKNRTRSLDAIKGNINAAKALSSLLQTSLGPNSMMKMLITKMGTLITNDGNCILRDLTFSHPAAKFIIELSRTQEQESGDGTTSVVILACELLDQVKDFIISEKSHPNEVLECLEKFQFLIRELSPSLAFSVGLSEESADVGSDLMFKTLKTTLNSKLVSGNEQHIFEIAKLALESVFGGKLSEISFRTASGGVHASALISNFRSLIKIQKIEGGLLEDSYVIKGVILDKEPIDPTMLTKITDPKVLILDGALEYKKAESHTEIELIESTSFAKMLDQEEQYLKTLSDAVINSGANLVFCQGGTNPLAAHFLARAGVTVFRRLSKPQLFRLSKATGAKVTNTSELVSASTEELKKLVGGYAKFFELRRINDTYFSFVSGCDEGKSVTIVLRGGSKELMKEFEANLDDAIGVLLSLVKDNRILCGGGGFEVEMHSLLEKLFDEIREMIKTNGENKTFKELTLTRKEKRVKITNSNGKGVSISLDDLPILQNANNALLTIPKILAKNCGKCGREKIKEIRKHLETNKKACINGKTGEVVIGKEAGILDSFFVKESVLKTALEAAKMILRIDDVLQGLAKKSK